MCVFSPSWYIYRWVDNKGFPCMHVMIFSFRSDSGKRQHFIWNDITMRVYLCCWDTNESKLEWRCLCKFGGIGSQWSLTFIYHMECDCCDLLIALWDVSIALWDVSIQTCTWEHLEASQNQLFPIIRNYSDFLENYEDSVDSIW